MRENILKAIWFTPGIKGRWGLPLLVEGRPGTGKTSIIEAAAQACGFHTEVVIASLREPADFLGLPIPNKNGTVSYAPPAWAARAAEAKYALVFFDELSTAPPAVQAALLRTVLDGVVGDLVLPPTVRFIAAQNATEEAAGGWDLAAPLSNRFGHRKWESPDADAWAEHLLSAHDASAAEVLNAASEESRVMTGWASPWARARGVFAGFIKSRPELLLKMPAAGDPAASKAWPSPRSMEMACRALAGAEIHSLSEVETDDLIADFIGVGAASELATWKANADLPDPADVLDGKVTFKHEPARLDRTAAVLLSCAALVSPTAAEKRKPRANELWKVLGDVCNDATDLAVPSARILVKSKLISLEDVPNAKPVLARLAPILRAAGVMA